MNTESKRFCRCENGSRNHPRASRFNPQGDVESVAYPTDKSAASRSRRSEWMENR